MSYNFRYRRDQDREVVYLDAPDGLNSITTDLEFFFGKDGGATDPQGLYLLADREEYYEIIDVPYSGSVGRGYMATPVVPHSHLTTCIPIKAGTVEDVLDDLTRRIDFLEGEFLSGR